MRLNVIFFLRFISGPIKCYSAPKKQNEDGNKYPGTKQSSFDNGSHH